MQDGSAEQHIRQQALKSPAPGMFLSWVKLAHVNHVKPSCWRMAAFHPVGLLALTAGCRGTNSFQSIDFTARQGAAGTDSWPAGADTWPEQPGSTRSSQEQPGVARSSQKQPLSSQEQPGAARSSQKQPEAASRSQEQPDHVKSREIMFNHVKQPGAARSC